MTVHDYEPGSFYPTELQPRYDGLNFLPINTLLSATGDRVRQKATELVKAASDYHAATLKDVRRPLDREIAEFINRIAESLLTGTEVLNPFPAETRTWIVQNMGVSAEWSSSWERICQGLLQGGVRELSLCDFLLWHERIDHVIRGLRRIRVALRMETEMAEISRKTALAIQGYAERRGGDRPPLIAEPMQSILCAFLTQWVRLLRFGSEPELHLNLCRLWAELLAPKFSLSVPEWQFLVATLDLHIRDAVGPALHRVVSPFADTLHHSSSRFVFCGELYRRLHEVETVLEPQAAHLPFKWQELLQEIVGEVVWAAAPNYGASPMAARILQGVKVLGDVRPDEFREFCNRLVNCCRPLGERNWLDWLDEALDRVQAALDYVDGWEASEATLKGAIQATGDNLREGRDAFATHVHLSNDLAALIDAAFRAGLLHPDISQARRHFRAWFSDVLLTRRPAEFWRHAQTLARALGTCLRQAASNNDFLRRNLPAIELLGEVVAAAPLGDWLGRAWAEANKIVVDSEMPSCHRDVQWVLRKAAVELVRSGQTRAAAEVGRWILDEVVPYVPSVPAERFEQTYLELKETVSRTSGALHECGFDAVLDGVCEVVPAALSSHILWMNSEGLGNEIARRVFAELPEYAAKTGISGAASCARDNALTLRRVALALAPGTPNAADHLADWWGNLINAYVVNRPGGLFRTNCDILIDVCGDHLTVRQKALVSALVRPLYEGAATEADAGTQKLPRFDRLAWKLPLATVLPSTEGFAWESERTNVRAMLEGGLGTAREYGSRIKGSGENAIDHLLPKMTAHLADGFPAWRWHGTLDLEFVRSWRQLLEAVPKAHETIEAMLHGWMQFAGSYADLALSIPATGYLQEVVEFNRQCAAGLALKREAPNLARLITQSIHASVPDLLAVGVQAASPEKCARDLGMILSALADGMTNLPRPGAILHLQRALAEQIAPHVSYGERIWRMVWLLASQVSKASFAPALHREVNGWFVRFESCGTQLPTLGAFNRRLFLADEPQFSSDPEEEHEWRKTVSTLLVLDAYHPPGERDADLLRAVVCASLPLLQEEDFGDRLEAIAEAFKMWFVDVDVREPSGSLLAFKKTWESWRRMAAVPALVPGINSQLVARLPFLGTGAAQIAGFHSALNWFTLQVAIASIEGQWRAASNTWGLPTPLRFVHGPLSPLFASLDADAVAAWSTSFSNAFGSAGLPTNAVASVVADAVRSLSLYESVVAVWVEPWDVAHSISAGTVSCARDLHWLARRIAIDGLAGRPPYAADGAAAWFYREILPYAGVVRAADYLPCLQRLARAATTRRLAESVVRRFTEFRAGAAGLLAAHLITQNCDHLADAAMFRFSGRRPDYAGMLDESQTAACRRDAILTFQALANAASGVASAVPFKHWWHLVIAPHLSEKETPIVPIFRAAMLDTLAAEFEPEIARAAELVLCECNTNLSTWANVHAEPRYGWHETPEEILAFCERGGERAREYALQTTGFDPEAAAGAMGTLAEGWWHFHWTGQLSGDVSARWRALLAGQVNVPAFARFIQGLMQQTAHALSPLEGVKMVSYLQALLDFHRQCEAGIAISEISEALALSVATSLHRSIGSDLAAEGKALKPHECARDLGMVFDSVGRALTLLPRSAALFRIARVLAEEIAPFTTYSERVWRMVWMTAAQEAEGKLSPEAFREWRKWCARLESIGTLMVPVGTVMRRLLATDVSSETLALWRTRESLRQTLAATLLGDSDAVELATAEHTSAEWTGIKADVLDIDLATLDRAVGRVLAAAVLRAERAEALEKLGELLPPLAGRVPLIKTLSDQGAAGWRTLGALFECSLAPHRTGNSWNLPAVAGLCDDTVLKTFSFADETEIRRLVHALARLARSRTDADQRIGESCSLLVVMGSELPSLEYAWTRPWAIDLPVAKRSFFSFGSKKGEADPAQHPSCSRDLNWTARRLAVEAWTAPSSADVAGQATARWLASEVIPFAGAVALENWAECATSLESNVRSAPAATAAQRSAAVGLRQSLPAHAAAVSLAAQERQIAEEVVTLLCKKSPKYAELLSRTNRESCLRDTRLTLAMLGQMVTANGERSARARSWWQETIGRHLASETHGILGQYRDCMETVISRSLPRETASLFNELIHVAIAGN